MNIFNLRSKIKFQCIFYIISLLILCTVYSYSAKHYFTDLALLRMFLCRKLSSAAEFKTNRFIHSFIKVLYVDLLYALYANCSLSVCILKYILTMYTCLKLKL